VLLPLDRPWGGMSQDLLVAGHSNSFEFSIIPKWCQQFSLLPIFSMIFCDFLSSCTWLTYFNPPDPSSGPTSSPTPWRRQRDEVLAVSNRFCCSSADKTLGRSTWDLQGLGMAWDVEISCTFLHGPKLSEFTLQKHEQVYSVHFV
jgi:hypothetical protein